MVSPEDCNCAHLCPDGRCIAIWVYDKAECWLLCSTDQATSSKTSLLALDARIGIEVKNTTLAGLGKFMASISMTRLLIPADSVENKLSFSMPDTTLAAALQKAGFVFEPNRML